MIPSRAQCLELFDIYNLPSQKRIHVELVAKVAAYIANKIEVSAKGRSASGGHSSHLPAQAGFAIKKDVLEAAALLHDIDKNIPKNPGERHPQTAVRVLTELGFSEVAQVVAHHSLHQILDEKTAPQTLEEKILYLADKMVKYEVIGVDQRFKLWENENLPPQAREELKQSYPLVKALEHELLTQVGMNEAELIQNCR